MARPSKYAQLDIRKQLDSIRGWARQGATMEELAEMLGVAESTIYEWKKKYPEFSEAINTGARKANGEILNAMFNQTTGYYRPETEIKKVKKLAKDDKGNPIFDPKGRPVLEEVLEVVTFEVFQPPVPTVGIFMTKNRLPREYKERRDEPTGEAPTILVDEP